MVRFLGFEGWQVCRRNSRVRKRQLKWLLGDYRCAFVEVKLSLFIIKIGDENQQRILFNEKRKTNCEELHLGDQIYNNPGIWKTKIVFFVILDLIIIIRQKNENNVTKK